MGRWLVQGWLCFCLLLVMGCSALQKPTDETAATAPSPWPPKVGEPYPDLSLVDQDGNTLDLASLKGKVLLIEPVGLSCEACNAFSGGGIYGGFDGAKSQANLDSIETYLPQYSGGVEMNNSNLVFVQLLLYNKRMEAPSLEEVKAWADHFHFTTAHRQYVLGGTPALVNSASYAMIPGFQLVDKDFILRADSTGHSPKDDLFQTLLPMLPQLLRE